MCKLFHLVAFGTSELRSIEQWPNPPKRSEYMDFLHVLRHVETYRGIGVRSTVLSLCGGRFAGPFHRDARPKLGVTTGPKEPCRTHCGKRFKENESDLFIQPLFFVAGCG